MGELDKLQKRYFKDSKRFADVFNAILYHGEQVISPDELEDDDSVLTYAQGNHSMERIADLIKKRKKDGETLGLMIIENQKKIDCRMPIRIMMTEAMAYDRQAKEIADRNKAMIEGGLEMQCANLFYWFTVYDRVRPVTTIVLCWNSNGWDGPRSLWDIVDFTGVESLRDYVPEYPINVYDMLKDADEEAFKSDLQVILGVCKRKRSASEFKEYVETVVRQAKLDDEAYGMLGCLMESKKLFDHMEQIMKDGNLREDEKGEAMCKALEDLMEMARQEGREEERAQRDALKARNEELEARMKDQEAKAKEQETIAADQRARADKLALENERLKRQLALRD